MAISHWPVAERPRQRLLTLGPKHLTDAELVAIFLSTGSLGLSAVEVARQLLVRFGGLHELLAASEKECCLQQGVGSVKYAQLQAAQELGLRLQKSQLKKFIELDSSQKVGTYLQCEIGHYTREVFCVLLLDNQHRLLELVELFQGTINRAHVYPREVVKLALTKNAVAVILAHNRFTDHIQLFYMTISITIPFCTRKRTRNIIYNPINARLQFVYFQGCAPTEKRYNYFQELKRGVRFKPRLGVNRPLTITIPSSNHVF